MNKYTTTTYADGVPYTSAETDSLPEPEEVDVLTDEFAISYPILVIFENSCSFIWSV